MANKYFPNFLQYEPFEVISTHASSSHEQTLTITLPDLFKCNETQKFYVYNVDNRYDGLIGSDLLKQLNAKIDMSN